MRVYKPLAGHSVKPVTWFPVGPISVLLYFHLTPGQPITVLGLVTWNQLGKYNVGGGPRLKVFRMQSVSFSKFVVSLL